MNILIADQEGDVRILLELFFAGRGHRVQCVDNGQKALKEVTNSSPDLVLLEIELPGKDGWELIEAVRSMGDTPIIVMSALDEAVHVVRSLELGADDYLRKPFDLSELEARVRAVMRRYRKHRSYLVERSGPIRIDDISKSVKIEGAEVNLSPREYNLLKLFVESPGTVLDHDSIIKQVWPQSDKAAPADVKQYIYLLRSKIEENPGSPRFIHTVKGFGYKYIPK